MGVPKFFRYISERYPCLSESVKDYEIPDFDNLYLDMNGIIHNCSHPDDGNPHFRITEEKIFADVFHYIEILFQMIKPQKVFFMAVDGVAPRAKMNQQRGRRFRSAKDAQKLENEAKQRGEKLPEESRFDSNCITPGTEFMARLHEQLKYFVVKKVSHDPLWQRCEVILSGHETPGEGEHKIMDYIRYRRSQPGYDPNTRHCLYGLDADLIMLGLCTHDPHFSLLREEVKFGKKSTKKSCVPEEIRFFLLHLSLMREYLEMEFGSLKQMLKNFDFNIENIIDDWVLMGFLVGNDFIPNLPNLHITDGALPVLYKAYINILPQLDGYINESGILNLKRFEIFMKKLAEIDIENFEEVRDDLLYMSAKTGRKMEPFSKNNAKLRNQSCFVAEGVSLKPEFLESVDPKVSLIDSGLSALIASTEIDYLDDDEEENEQPSDYDEDDEEFENYKKNYYMNKLEYAKVTPEVMKSQAEGYVRAIQWNLHYYYNGVCSWSWYYPHHYSPFISDIKNFQNLKLEYDIGRPFMPYEQLLAVLPAASKQLLPECYQRLMTDENSPIKQYYPENFETDLNGKKQEWEAVVLVPFIDEDILLETMKCCNSELTCSEAERNMHGPMLSYRFTDENLGTYEAPMYFPKIVINHAKLRPIAYKEIVVPINKLVKGAYPGVLMDVYYPGFPTLKHLNYQGQLKKAKVKVFEQSSRGENMIVQVIPSERVLDATIPLELLNEIVYVGWPHLVEAKVVSVSNNKEQYTYQEGKEPLITSSALTFKHEVDAIADHYANRMGIEFGKVIVLVTVKKMIGRKYIVISNGRISLEKTFCEHTSSYPLQLIVENINVHSESQRIFQSLNDAFPVESTCFVLTKNDYYGAKGIVKMDDKTPEGRVCVSVTTCDEPDLSGARYLTENVGSLYRTLYVAASQLGMSNYIFSRITGSFFVTAKNREGCSKTINLGLNLKLNKKNLETSGYTKKISGTWFYTDAAIDAVGFYADEFPEVLQYIASAENQKDDTSIEDIFPVDSDEKGKAVLAWLKSQPHSHAERRECNSTMLDNEVIEEIENTIDRWQNENSKKVVLYCKPNSLFKPDLCFGNLLPDPSVEVQLFDRIINIRENHTVPFGLKGTIIGINRSSSEIHTEHLYDVLFDSKFEGGIQINCTSGRGYRLPLNAFIDISHGKRLQNANSSKSDSTKASFNQMQKEDNYRKSNYNSRNNTHTSNVTSSSSAFAKFNNNQFSTPHSYNAVPPFMPNGEPIYRSNNTYNNQQNYHNYQPQKFADNNTRYEQLLDYRNPFPKQYDANSYVGSNNSNKNHNQNKDGKIMKEGHSARKNQNRDERNAQKKSDFMPAFKKMDQNKAVEETADALKKILKVGTSNENEMNKQTIPLPESNKQNVPLTRNNKQSIQGPQTHKQNIPVHQTNKQNIVLPETEDQPKYQIESRHHVVEAKNQQHITQPNIPFSVQLLTYYQSNGLGLPRYQYVSTDDGIQSQIKLPNRQILLGPPAKTREDASELVAEQAMSNLNFTGDNTQHKKSTELKESPKKIPIPPVEWWRQESKTSSQPQVKQISKTQSNIEAANNTWKGLIPLQVVKKEKANSSSSSDVMNIERKNKNSKTILNENPDNAAKEIPQVSQKKEGKPKKQRKMRIAANFGMKS